MSTDGDAAYERRLLEMIRTYQVPWNDILQDPRLTALPEPGYPHPANRVTWLDAVPGSRP